jgi:hypothetical protein
LAEKVTLSQYNAFLAAKAPEKPCPECGVNHWTFVGGDSAPDSGETIVDTLFLLGTNGGGLGVKSLICTNCGFTKFFASGFVEAWVDSNG